MDTNFYFSHSAILATISQRSNGVKLLRRLTQSVAIQVLNDRSREFTDEENNDRFNIPRGIFLASIGFSDTFLTTLAIKLKGKRPGR